MKKFLIISTILLVAALAIAVAVFWYFSFQVASPEYSSSSLSVGVDQ